LHTGAKSKFYFISFFQIKQDSSLLILYNLDSFWGKCSNLSWPQNTTQIRLFELLILPTNASNVDLSKGLNKNTIEFDLKTKFSAFAFIISKFSSFVFFLHLRKMSSLSVSAPFFELG
jgi:hypothetical protein